MAAVTLLGLLIGALGSGLGPQATFGIFERFSVFSIVVFTGFLGFYGLFYSPQIPTE